MSLKIMALLPIILFSHAVFAQACSASVTCGGHANASCNAMSESSASLDGISNGFKVGACGTSTDNKSAFCENRYYNAKTGALHSTYRYYICCTADNQAVSLPVDAVAGALLNICDHI